MSLFLHRFRVNSHTSHFRVPVYALSHMPQLGPRDLTCLHISEHHVTKLLRQKAISRPNFRYFASYRQHCAKRQAPEF